MYIGCAKTGPILAQPGEIKMVVLDCAGLGQVVPKRDHILAQPMMVVVLGCAKTGPVFAQPSTTSPGLC